MFETAVVQFRHRKQSRAGLLTISLAAHTVVGAALVLAGIQSLQFPTNAPNQMGHLYDIAPPPVPPALGTPHPAHPSAQPAAPRTPAAAPRDAPPLTIPEHVAPVTPDAIGPASSDTNASDGPIGSPIGVKDSISTEVPVAQPVTPPRVYATSEVTNPPVAIKRVSPDFPTVAQRMRLSGWVVVEGIIDTTGRIREPRVVASSFSAFEKPALDAVQQWEFRPGMLRGAAVDTLFQLKVTFTLR